MPTWLLVTICVICWGTWAVFEKMGTKHVTPMMQVISAYVYSAVAPLVFLYQGDGSTIQLKLAWRTVDNGCLRAGDNRQPVLYDRHSEVPRPPRGGLFACLPILTFLLCAIFLGEPVTGVKLLEIVAIVLGTILLAT